MLCPCGSGSGYSVCCGLFHDRIALPETAEQLMRSRYSAYVTRKIDYLISTHDQDTRADFNPLAAGQWASKADWKRLDIISVLKGRTSDDVGMVEFIAWYLHDGRLTCHHERSNFRRLDGHWAYSDGSSKAPDRVIAALGRNDPCPCGSGHKFKKCHGG